MNTAASDHNLDDPTAEPFDQVIPEAPIHEDGTPYQFEMVSRGGRRTYGDTYADLIPELLGENYYSHAEDQQWLSRLMCAVTAQIIEQTVHNQNIGLEKCSLEAQAVLTYSRHDQPSTTHWDEPVPLVLVASYYEPAGDIPRPQPLNGVEPNVLWIDPSDEDSLLNSLHDIGHITLNVHESRGEPDAMP